MADEGDEPPRIVGEFVEYADFVKRSEIEWLISAFMAADSIAYRAYPKVT